MSRFLLALIFGAAASTATACYGTTGYVVDDYDGYYTSPYVSAYSTWPYATYPYYAGYPYYRGYYRPYYDGSHYRYGTYGHGHYRHGHYRGTPHYQAHGRYHHGGSGYHARPSAPSTRGAPGGVRVSPPPTRGGRG
jgi:hypothetical protein